MQKKHSEIAEEFFGGAADGFTDLLNKPNPTAADLVLSLQTLATGLWWLAKAVGDLGDMIRQIERDMSGPKRGPAGL